MLHITTSVSVERMHFPVRSGGKTCQQRPAYKTGGSGNQDTHQAIPNRVFSSAKRSFAAS